MRAIVFAATLLSGCSLIVDVDKVRSERDAQPMIADAQLQPDGGVARDADAPDVHEDATVVQPDAEADAGFPDATNPCLRADTGVLNCETLVLAAQTPDLSALDGHGDVFFGAISRGNTVEVYRIDQAMSPIPIQNFQTNAAPIDLSISTRDGQFAVAWIELGERAVHCRTSIATSSASRAIVDQDIEDVSIALAPSGAISIVATQPFFFTTNIYTAESPIGCPATLTQRAPFYYTRGVATAWIDSRNLFRYSLTAIHPNLEDSSLLIHDVTGQMIRVYVYSGTGIQAVAHAPTSSGQYLVQMFGYGDPAAQQITITAHSTDLMTINAPDRVLPMSATNFDMTGCGVGCTAGAILSDDANGRISAAFFSDDLSIRWFNETMFDVACNLNSFGDLDVGWAGDRLGFLFTDGTRATLYLCDKPF